MGIQGVLRVRDETGEIQQAELSFGQRSKEIVFGVLHAISNTNG